MWLVGGSALPAWADEAGGDDAAVTAEQGSSRDYSGMSLEQLKAEVSALEAQRDGLSSQHSKLLAQTIGNNERLMATSRKLDDAQARAEEAVAERYKLQRYGSPLIDTLLSADSLPEFIDGLRYIEAASDVSVEEVLALRERKAQCEQVRDQLALQSVDVKAQAEQVAAELQVATAARDEKQRLADLAASVRLVPDGANWDADEEAFIAEWGPRLEAYLAGSPLAGQGAVFAKAAWDNHIDPRWSAAISNIESSKGRLCIRPYNAWGWGAADSDPYNLAYEWASWEQSINAHASGLARGYGYTVSMAGAQTYCPSNWENWYVSVVNGMNSI